VFQQSELKNWVSLIESNLPQNVQLALALAEGIEEFTEGMLGILCVNFHKWKEKNQYKSYYDYSLFQCNRLNWEPKTKDDVIAEQIKLVLAAHTSYPVDQLLESSQLFYLIYPIPVYVGNADCGGYTGNVQELFEKFLPFAAMYEEALEISEQFASEYITLAQILWAYFRWLPTNSFKTNDCFSVKTADYFLGKAIKMQPEIPIHYIAIFKKHAYWDKSQYIEAEEYTLQSKNGLTFFYYAQCCQYHTLDFEKALFYYQQFLKAEPELLPENNFKLYFDESSKRYYYPSVQEALTEIGKIYLEQNKPKEAEFYLRRAIDCRPEHHQTPYEWMAVLKERQGKITESLEYFALKVAYVEKSNLRYFGENEKHLCYFNYKPVAEEKPNRAILNTEIDYSEKLQTTLISSVLLHIADTYLFELTDYQNAGIYYKKALFHCNSEQKIQIIENQIRIAVDMEDYWQARNLAEKLMRLQKSNPTAKLYLQKIRSILGY
jgi:tetratricopeptide (TPR) repeat protein